MELKYKSQTEDCYGNEIRVDYFIEVNTVEKHIWWNIFPHAPKGMHFKKADEYRLGTKHSIQKQSYAEFKKAPHDELPEHIFKIIQSEIEQNP